MVRSEIAARYSRALFNFDSSDEEIEKRLISLQGFSGDFLKNKALKNFFLSPQISLKDKNKVIEKGLQKVEDPTLTEFLKFILLKGHFKLIPQVALEYKQLINEKMGTLEGTLVTSIAVEKVVKEQLLKTLEKIFGKKIELTEIVDSDLIGGGIVSVNNQLLDFSLKGKLAKLKEDLLSVNVYRRSK